VNKNFVHWLLFCLLSLIWGSSFILMKIGMNNHLSSYQVASLRIIAAGLVLLPVAVRQARNIPGANLVLVFLSGTIGSMVPAYLFCIAEEVIDSSLAGTLNCLTPIFVIITGVMFFKVQPPVQKLMGILIAFAGSLLLLLSKEHLNEDKHLLYVSLVIFATFLYGFNVNLVSKYLKEISSFHLAAVALTLNAIPAAIVLYFTGYFTISIGAPGFLIATGAASLLGVVGTAVATIIFYMLVKSAGGIFASMVTYGIPVVAIFWGIYYGEAFGGNEAIALLVILLGVYFANRKLGSPKNSAKKKPSGKEGVYKSV
jgi:drug/metabolite transporter (DMT)-like permease